MFGIDGDALYVTDGAVGLALSEGSDDDEGTVGPWTGPHAVEIEFSVTGDAADASGRSIVITTTGEGFHTVGTVGLGSATESGSVTVAGPSLTDTAPVTIDPDTRYRATFDTRSGELVGKVWEVTSGEPAEFDVVTALDETEDEADTFSLLLTALDDGGTQTIRIHSLSMAAAASSGDHVVYEWLGFASGDTDRFRTRHRFRLGTLVGHVNGIDAEPVWEDGIEFRLDAFPTAASGIHASYIAE